VETTVHEMRRGWSAYSNYQGPKPWGSTQSEQGSHEEIERIIEADANQTHTVPDGTDFCKLAKQKVMES